VTISEKLELAGYRLMSLAQHMPTEWQQKVVLEWGEDAIDAARGIEAQRGETAQQARSEGRKPGHEVTRHDTGGQQQRNGK